MRTPAIDMTGRRCGRWTVLGREANLPASRANGARWHVRCECGNESVRSGKALRKGVTKQCRRCQLMSRKPCYAKAKLTAEMMRLAVKLRADRKAWWEIERRVGWSYSIIQREMAAHGHDVRPLIKVKPRWSKDRLRELRDLLRTMTEEQTAQHLGIKLCSVRYALKKYGMQRARVGRPSKWLDQVTEA